MIVKRFFSKNEIAEKLENTQSQLEKIVERKASEIAGEHIEVSKRRKSATYQGKRELITGDETDDIRQLSPRSRRRREQELEKISEEESDDARIHSKERQGSSKRHERKQGKKKVEYKGMVQYVTDDDSSEESDQGRSKTKTKGHQHEDSESETESDDEGGNYSGRKRAERRLDGKKHHRSQRKGPYDQDEEEDSSEEEIQISRMWKKDRLPYYDEYVFPCHRWLATDEGDGQLNRVLKPNKVTTYFKVNGGSKC